MHRIFDVDYYNCMAKTHAWTQCSFRPQNDQRYCECHNTKSQRPYGDFQIQSGGFIDKDIPLTIGFKMHDISDFVLSFEDNISYVDHNRIRLDILSVEAELAIHRSDIIDISSDSDSSDSVSSLDSLDSNCPEEWGITEDCECDRCTSARAQWCICGDPSYGGCCCGYEAQEEEKEEEENLYPHQCGICLRGAVVYRPICCDKKQNICEACWDKCVETKKGCPFCRSQSFVPLFEFLKDQYLVSSS